MNLLTEHFILRTDMDPERALAALRTSTSTDVLTERPKPLAGRLTVTGRTFQLRPRFSGVFVRHPMMLAMVRGELREGGGGTLADVRMRPTVLSGLTCLAHLTLLGTVFWDFVGGMAWIRAHPFLTGGFAVIAVPVSLLLPLAGLWSHMEYVEKALCDIWQASPIKK